VVDDTPDDELLAASGLNREMVSSWTFRKGLGCKACRNTGYQGRKAIAEVLRLNDELKQAIASRAPAVELKQLAARFGFLSMRRQAMNVVASGETTLQEINRVTFVD
jgi:general secretion pathway protein E